MLRGGAAPRPAPAQPRHTPARGRNTRLWSMWEAPTTGSFPSPLFGGGNDCIPAKVRATEGLRWDQSLVQQNLISPPQALPQLSI